jgi:hypothetical protein
MLHLGPQGFTLLSISLVQVLNALRTKRDMPFNEVRFQLTQSCKVLILLVMILLVIRDWNHDLLSQVQLQPKAVFLTCCLPSSSQPHSKDMPYASCVILIVSIFCSPVTWGATVLPFKRANKLLLPSSLSLGQVKLTIMIEDPRIAEQREKYGIEDDSGVSREELAAALVDVRRRLTLQSSS